MKLAINTNIDAECDEESLRLAADIIQKVQSSEGDDAEKVLSALLVALFFRELERKYPGSIDQLIRSIKA